MLCRITVCGVAYACLPSPLLKLEVFRGLFFFLRRLTNVILKLQITNGPEWLD